MSAPESFVLLVFFALFLGLAIGYSIGRYA